jgi:hypothetical protein
VARKEDGFYIDPRTNGGANIEAITLDDVVITDGNGSIISRHAKRQNDGGDQFAAEESRDEEKENGNKEEESTTGEGVTEESLSEDKKHQRQRREIVVNQDNNGRESKKSDVQPVSRHNRSQNCTYTACPKSSLRSFFLFSTFCKSEHFGQESQQFV